MMLTAGAKTPAKAMCGQGGFGDSVPIPCGCDEVGPGWLCGAGNCNISGTSEYIIYTCGGCVPPD